KGDALRRDAEPCGDRGQGVPVGDGVGQGRERLGGRKAGGERHPGRTLRLGRGRGGKGGGRERRPGGRRLGRAHVVAGAGGAVRGASSIRPPGTITWLPAASWAGSVS